MKRLPDWRSRFNAEIDALKAKPFAWGEHDCGPGLVGRLVFAMTGEDASARFKGRYKTAKGALGVMRRAGFDNLADLVASVLPEIQPSRARVGDIVAYPTDTAFGFSLGVVNGERSYVLREDGMGTMSTLSATRAFRVG